jgi:hypothetical protein
METWTMLHRQIRKLLDNCYLAKASAAATLCKDKKLEISHIIVSLKTLLFKLYECGKNIVWTNSNTKLYKYLNCFERLQLKFEGIKGEQHLKVLRQKKILAFCQSLRLSIEEATFLTTLVPSIKNKALYLKKLIKYKQRVFLLVCEKEDAWTKKYLSQVKKFKSCADKVSDAIHVLAMEKQ